MAKPNDSIASLYFHLRQPLQPSMEQSPLLETSSEPAVAIIAINVEGMKCAGCVQTVEKQLTQHPGVLSASVNLVTQVATVQCQPGTAPKDLAGTLTKAGFPSQPREQQAEATTAQHKEAQQQLLAQIQRVMIAGALVVLSGLGHLDQIQGLTIPGLSNIWFHWGLATIALLGPGRSMLVDGWYGLRRNAPNMNTLVSLGTLTAYTASLVALLFPSLGWECFFDEPVMIVGLILLGRTLEQQARGRAASALRGLLSLQPRMARWIPHPSLDRNRSVEVPVEQIQVGAWLQVCSGEKFPVDGEILVGKTTVDESMLTGESLPAFKEPGDLVTGGTLNQSGAVTLKATRTGQDTTLAQIITQVEAAQTRKAPVQRLADVIAGYFTYGVMAIAALTFVFWYLASSHWPVVLASSFPHHHSFTSPVAAHPLLLGLKLAIAVLVVACPCALGLATPTAILVGTSLGAERGLLIRGGDVLERVHQLDTVVFDKTGTLTTGQLTVTDYWVVESLRKPQLTPNRLLQIAATVESGVRHPLAQAIQQQAQAQALPLLSAQDFYAEPGLGVSAYVEGEWVRLGTFDWLTEQGIQICPVDQNRAIALAKAGKSLVYVAIADEFVGLIAVTDTLRSDAAATVSSLQSMGLRVMILTGDRREAAEAMLQPLNLSSDDLLAEVRPAQKAAKIAQLQAEGQQVAMVGDGSNDAPALAQADIGIALHSGTDVAVETAQIVLMRDWVHGGTHLIDVLEAIRLSRATFSKIQQNLFWAFAYNLLGIPMAAGILLPAFGILLSPTAAGAMMAFSSVSVVTNSLLLRRTYRPAD